MIGGLILLVRGWRVRAQRAVAPFRYVGSFIATHRRIYRRYRLGHLYIVAVNWLGFVLTSFIILTVLFRLFGVALGRSVVSRQSQRSSSISRSTSCCACRCRGRGRPITPGSPMLEHLAQAFSMVFEPYTILVMVLASLFGLFVGAVPGLTATMATALLVPVTFFMPPIPAIAAIVTATAMAIFSGDIPGALLRIPGTPASAAYTDEAFAMTRKWGMPSLRSAPDLCSLRSADFGTAVLIVALALADIARASARSSISGWCCSV